MVRQFVAVEVISERRLRDDCEELLHRAAAGEVFRIAVDDVVVELRRARPLAVEQARATGLLTEAADDDLSDFPDPEPLPDGMTFEQLMEDVRGDR